MIPSDDDLVPRLKARDEAAFLALVETYHGSLTRLARAYVPSEAVAEEVVQETWVAVIDGIDRFDRRSTLKTWLFRILTNRAKTRGARERRTVPASALGDDPAVDPGRFNERGMWGIAPRRWEDDTPERLTMNREAITHLEAAIAGLPEQQRLVVTLRDVEGLDAVETCELLEITEVHQRVLLHRGRSKLRQTLQAYVESE